MNRFLPQLEAFEPRACPSATPLPFAGVGPALVYAIEQPPPPGPHDHMGWQRLAARFDAQVEAAAGLLSQPPPSKGGDLRALLETLRDQLRQDQYRQETAGHNADNRQALNLFGGHLAAAARAGTEADNHWNQWRSYGNQANDLDNLLQASDDQLRDGANALAIIWRDQLVTDVYAGRDAYARTQNPNLTRAQYHAAVDALGQVAAYDQAERVGLTGLIAIVEAP